MWSTAEILGAFSAAVVSFGYSGAHVVSSDVLGFHSRLLCVTESSQTHSSSIAGELAGLFIFFVDADWPIGNASG